MNNRNFIPVISYSNASLMRNKILKENKNKSGIYCWNNLSTKKCYVGSSASLSRRLGKYYSVVWIKNSLNKSKSLIYESVLKYGHSNFSLDILEYCESNILIEREQYYIDILNPKYNILKFAGSPLGRKLSTETREKISATLKTRLSKLLPIKVICLETQKIKHFATNLEAAKFLGVSLRTLTRYKNTKVLKNKYMIYNDIYGNKCYK